MANEMILRIWDVEHGACAMLHHNSDYGPGKLAMIDSGHNTSTGWKPSFYIKTVLQRQTLDYLIITNADQDHLSDLEGLWEEGISVPVLIRNRHVSPAELRVIKNIQGELTDDIERYIQIHDEYTYPVSEPFDDNMGGIKITTFYNRFPDFIDTNNLSTVVFISFGEFKILFPGDMEKDGWKALLKRPEFVEELKGTTILNASHHGRENGYLADIFEHFTPMAVVISDKPIVHATQETVPNYRYAVREQGISVRTTKKSRHVLTTRRDGSITFTVSADGSFHVDTEKLG